MRCRLSEKDGVGEIESLGETYPSEMTNVDMISISPSGKFTALLKSEDDSTIDNKSGKKQYLEVWQEDCLLHCELLSGSKSHGLVFHDGRRTTIVHSLSFASFELFFSSISATFGALEWSPAEDRLLFIAERYRTKAISYFEKSNALQNLPSDQI
jgi:hypothetical protein